MSVEIFTDPSLAREFTSTNPFVADKRCEVFQVAVGDEYNEVMSATLNLHHGNISPGSEYGERYIFDLDVVFDNVSGRWVGFTCKDVEPFE